MIRTILLSFFLLIFIYFVGLGTTKIIGERVWGESNTDRTFWTPDWEVFAWLLWPITLLIWTIIGTAWVGYQLPKVVIVYVLGLREAQSLISQTEPPKPKRIKKKDTPKSGVELGIYKDKEEKK